MNQVEGHFPGRNDERASLLQMDVGASFNQIHGNAGIDSSDRSHAAGNDQHGPGAETPAGDADALVVPAMTDQLPTLTGQPLSPKDRLTFRFDRNTQSELSLKNGIRPSAQNQVNGPTSQEEELQCAFGQGLSRRPCDCAVSRKDSTSLKVSVDSNNSFTRT